MKIHASEANSHYWEVYLNGDPLPDCRMADEEEGVAEVCELTPNGKLIGIPGTDEVETRMVWGEVEIRPKAEPGKVGV